MSTSSRNEDSGTPSIRLDPTSHSTPTNAPHSSARMIAPIVSRSTTRRMRTDGRRRASEKPCESDTGAVPSADPSVHRRACCVGA